jgi:hypothetical protein
MAMIVDADVLVRGETGAFDFQRAGSPLNDTFEIAARSMFLISIPRAF